MVSWQYSVCGQIPFNAVWGGKDVDGSDLYVGRSMHEYDLLPGKVSQSRGGLFVPYGGGEHPKRNYEVLVNNHAVAWQECRGPNVPYRAVVGGHTSCGEQLFIGRVWHEGSITPGKVHRGHGKCHIPFGGKEFGYDHYEVLILV